jgi:hypothetical protein
MEHFVIFLAHRCHAQSLFTQKSEPKSVAARSAVCRERSRKAMLPRIGAH